MCVEFGFFQAEDGIRDLVRSRGLGDVYKRQVQTGHQLPHPGLDEAGVEDMLLHGFRQGLHDGIPVSYTHLTLPTSDLV